MDEDLTMQELQLLNRVPERFLWLKFDDFQTPTRGLRKVSDDVVEWVGRFAEFPGTAGLFLTGPVGTGKSMLAYIAALELARRFKSVGALNVTRHFASVRERIGNHERVPTPMQLTTDFAGKPYDLLLLDDLGVERATDWLIEQIYLLVDAAYCRDVKLLVTSNLGYEELSDRLGERTVSRVVELTDKVAFPLDTEDWRTRTARGRR